MNKVGRPTSIIQVNLNDIDKTLNHVIGVCSSEGVKGKLKLFCDKLRSRLVEMSPASTQTFTAEVDIGCQTDHTPEGAEEILEEIWKQELSESDQEFLLHNIFLNLPDQVNNMKVQINSIASDVRNSFIKEILSEYTESVINMLELNPKELYSKVQTLSFDDQVKFYSLLGQSYNAKLWKESIMSRSDLTSLTIPKLLKVSKADTLKTADKRILAFLEAMTAKTNRNDYNKSNTVELTNIIEALLKGRNKKYVSAGALKEHTIAYISSNKSQYVSDILCHNAKGNRHLVENILRNSQEACAFKDPGRVSLFVSFDNIQKLMKGHRLSECEQEKVYGIIVTSILAVLPDGLHSSDIQFKPKNNISSWFSELAFDERKRVYYNKIDSKILRSMIKVSKEDLEIVNRFWLDDLERQLAHVLSNTNENGDVIDIRIKDQQNKRRKICEEGHVNENVHKNRKNCTICKSRLSEISNDDSYYTFQSGEDSTNDESITPDEVQKLYYWKVDNIYSQNQPIEKSLGAEPINPNSQERIQKVMDRIKRKTGLNGHYSVEIRINNGEVSKEVIENNDKRSWILLSADGLPMKQIIQLIQNHYTCITCQKKVEHPSDLSEHEEESGHKHFYQTYSVFQPNCGQFHYWLCMFRSFVKLLWPIEYQELCKSVNLASPGAQMMIQKGSDVRKTADFIITARTAKLRELLYPFVVFAKNEKIEPTPSNFLRWVKESVKSKTYLSTLNIEQYFGTALILYRCAYRSNNLRLLKAAKNVFSSLFHINKNPNYVVLDMWSQYYDMKMSQSNPELSNYLSTRLFTNKSRKPYSAEPADELHEEYNRRGMRFQNNTDETTFSNSFTIVNDYFDMRDSHMSELGLKTEHDQKYRTHNLELNVTDMRIFMRRANYLNNPSAENVVKSLGGEELNESILKIQDIAISTRQENILQAMNKSDFFSSYPSTKCNFFQNDTEIEPDYEEQIRILISSIEDKDEMDQMYRYWLQEKRKKNYSEETFLNDMLNNKMYYS